MVLSKSKKRQTYKLSGRSSLLVHFKRKDRIKSELHFPKRSRTRNLIRDFHRTYQSLCLTVSLIFRLFVVIDKITREFFTFIEKLIQIIRVLYGWIQMIRSILSAVHLITSRIMMFSSQMYRIFSLLASLFEPIYNRTLEKSVQSFSHFLFDYYSSNGGCYTLQARTRQIVGRVRARWKRKGICIYDHDDEIYYDASSEEFYW